MPVRKEAGKKAVFLDRDGVLCRDTNYVTSFKKLEIFPFAREAVKLIQKKGYLAIVVTNQSAIARGMMTESALEQMNEFLKKEIGVDAIYYCPHLPPQGKAIPPYRIPCNCRKPAAGMLQRAALDYGIDLNKSYMAGDRSSDIETGRRAGVKAIYISEQKKENAAADAVYADILEFARALDVKKVKNKIKKI